MVAFDQWSENKRTIICQIALTVVPISVAQILLFGAWTDRMIADEFVNKTDFDPVNPHVVFQFSWTSNVGQEKRAVDNMSVYAGQGDLASRGTPKGAIPHPCNAKMRSIKGNDPPPPDDSSLVYGFDVYVVRPGERTGDKPACKYPVGRNEDVVIEVAPKDMGLLTDDPANANPFVISLSDIRACCAQIVAFEADK